LSIAATVGARFLTFKSNFGEIAHLDAEITADLQSMKTQAGNGRTKVPRRTFRTKIATLRMGGTGVRKDALETRKDGGENQIDNADPFPDAFWKRPFGVLIPRFSAFSPQLTMETLTCFLLGLGLSAACGFRVFVPLLGMNLAHLSGHLQLGSGFEWIGSMPALLVFGTATLLEICAFYVPWLNHFLDTIALPAAGVAGTLATASQLGDASPFLKWTLAAIAGGGLSATVHAGTAVLRLGSTAASGGLASLLVATGEGFASVLLTALAIFVPLLGFALCLGLLLWIATRAIRWLHARKRSPV
jgi:hypothetical protein